jgi:hypothetical protein
VTGVTGVTGVVPVETLPPHAVSATRSRGAESEWRSDMAAACRGADAGLRWINVLRAVLRRQVENSNYMAHTETQRHTERTAKVFSVAFSSFCALCVMLFAVVFDDP